MKKLIYISIILFYSCSATAVKENRNTPINDYLETQNLDNQKIMIIKEKINNNVTIDIFEGQTFYYEGPEKYIKVEGVQEPLYNKQLWEKMKIEYENKLSSDPWLKGSKWSRKDFRHKKILFFEKEKFPKPWKNEQFKFDDYYKVFTFSETIYYDNNKYAVFTKIKTSTSLKTFGGRSIIIMEKKEGKWVILKEVGDGVY